MVIRILKKLATLSLMLCSSLPFTLGALAQQPDSGQISPAQALIKYEQALQTTTAPQERFYLIKDAAAVAFEAGEMEKAKTFAHTLLEQAATFQQDWNYGNAIHIGNLVLGHVALASNNVEEAKRFLIASGKTPGSPQLNSFGPNMRLAKELLARGEREVVIDYLDLCAIFWKRHGDQLEEWKAVIQKGETPEFRANLVYGLTNWRHKWDKPKVAENATRWFLPVVFGVVGLGILTCLIPLIRRRERLGGILLSPGSAFRELVTQPDWVGAFCIVLVSALLGALNPIGMLFKMTTGISGFLRAMIFMFLLKPLITSFGVWFISTGCLWVFARISGEKTRFYTLLCIVGYASLPMLFASMMMLWVYSFEQASLSNLFQEGLVMPTSLARLFPDLIKGHNIGAITARALLKEIELFGLWSLVLTTIGTQRVYGFSMRKSAIINAIYWIVPVGISVGFALIRK